jgi:predicted metal-binding membrane protein
MLLLFAGGVMNLLLVAGIAALVLIEKISPLGGRTPYFTGGGAVVAGICVILFGWIGL